MGLQKMVQICKGLFFQAYFFSSIFLHQQGIMAALFMTDKKDMDLIWKKLQGRTFNNKDGFFHAKRLFPFYSDLALNIIFCDLTEVLHIYYRHFTFTVSNPQSLCIIFIVNVYRYINHYCTYL